MSLLKAKAPLITLLAALLLALLGALYTYYDLKTQTVIGFVNYITFDHIDDLKKASKAVVVAEPTGHWKNVIQGKGMGENGYTLTEVTVSRVMKNDKNVPISKNQNVWVTEPYYTKDRGIVPGKFKKTTDEYAEMKKNKKYVLFLAWDQRSNTYGVFTGAQGKYNIDGTDLEEEEKLKDSHLKDMKKQALEAVGRF